MTYMFENTVLLLNVPLVVDFVKNHFASKNYAPQPSSTDVLFIVNCAIFNNLCKEKSVDASSKKVVNRLTLYCSA